MKNRQIALILTSLWLNAVTAPAADPNRPKVGVALAGGGAKGFAHIGILKMLDSLQIPVDYIAGTSMGGIVAGLYAIGYDGLELEKLSHRTDWKEVFTDVPPRADLPYFQKKETGRYQIDFGIEGFSLVTPSALIYGQKVALLFKSLTYAFERVKTFDELPIPFRCVAVDLITGNEVVLGKGSLAKALRATMAIPTVFSPVDWGDSLLVDGGIVNNIPVDVVKAMGADIVIAVDISSPPRSKKMLNNAISILDQTIYITGIEKLKANLAAADVVIHPDMGDISPADFDSTKVRKIIHTGDLAARQALSKLIALQQTFHLRREPLIPSSVSGEQPKINSIQFSGQLVAPLDFLYDTIQLKPGNALDERVLRNGIASLKTSGYFDQATLQIVPLKNGLVDVKIRVREKVNPIIDGIEIYNNQKLPFSFIYRLLGLQPGLRLDIADLNHRIMMLYSLGYFESLQYDIVPAPEKRITIRLQVKELPARRLRMGLRYDDSYKLVAAINGQATNFIIPGLRQENEIQFAGLQKIRIKASYPSRTLSYPVYPLVQFCYRDIPVNIYDGRGNKIAKYKDRGSIFAVGAGLLVARYFNTEIQYQKEYVDIAPSIAHPDTAWYPRWKDDMRKIYVEFDFDVLDDVLLPRNGFQIHGAYEGSLKKLASKVPYSTFQVGLDYYYTFANSQNTLHFKAFYGTCSKYTPVYKYLNQGRPDQFLGMDYDMLLGNEISYVRGDYRVPLINNLYLTLSGNMSYHFKYRTADQLYQTRYLLGYGAGLKFTTPVGPFDVILARGDKNLYGSRKKQTLVYFTFGYKF